MLGIAHHFCGGGEQTTEDLIKRKGAAPDCANFNYRI
jgi:hypothetical protein